MENMLVVARGWVRAEEGDDSDYIGYQEESLWWKNS